MKYLIFLISFNLYAAIDLSHRDHMKKGTTQIQTMELLDEDIIRYDVLGTQRLVVTTSSKVSVNANLPEFTAVLDVVSNTQGALIPRMTTVQRDAIVGPLKGLMIYNTDTNDINMFGNNWSASTSQATVPIGTVEAFGGLVADIPNGWFLCDGTAIGRAGFNNLFAIIGEKFGHGDNATTFNLPDIRGKFIRQWANGSTASPNRNTRIACATGGNTGDNIGSCQADENLSHNHTAVQYFWGANSNWGSHGTSARNHVLGNAGGNESRPENLYVNYIIRAF